MRFTFWLQQGKNKQCDQVYWQQNTHSVLNVIYKDSKSVFSCSVMWIDGFLKICDHNELLIIKTWLDGKKRKKEKKETYRKVQYVTTTAPPQFKSLRSDPVCSQALNQHTAVFLTHIFNIRLQFRSYYFAQAFAKKGSCFSLTQYISLRLLLMLWFLSRSWRQPPPDVRDQQRDLREDGVPAGRLPERWDSF